MVKLQSSVEHNDKPKKKGKNKKSKKEKVKKTKSKEVRKQGKKAQEPQVSGKNFVIGAPTNKRKRLVDLGVTKGKEFYSSTNTVLTEIHDVKHLDRNRYEVESSPKSVSTILKLVLDVQRSNELSFEWSLILWNITQQTDRLPEGVSVTFTRIFERRENETFKKELSKRRNLAILSSDSESNRRRQTDAVIYDQGLLHAIESGDAVMGFGAEAIVTAPNEELLEQGVTAIKDYLKSNDETRGIKYDLDLNKQHRPFLIWGPNKPAGNGDVYVDMPSYDAAISSLIVDVGGDKTPGSEYLGMSVGKLIRSHAAYNLERSKSLYIGNDSRDMTGVMGNKDLDIPSQLYMSLIASRAYLLRGKRVTHFVADKSTSVDHLLKIPLYDTRKAAIDVSRGLLNILEAIDNGDTSERQERILGRFPAHLDNIVLLLSQFRDPSRIRPNDDFSSIANDILVNFFTVNRYWSLNAKNDIDNLRLVGVRHQDVKQLSDFGQYVNQRLQTNDDRRLEDALFELNTIINKIILPTIPSLDTKTDVSIDELVRMPYRVIDLTGMAIGSMSSNGSSSMNVMVIAYLNLVLPTLKNGDVIFFHGISRLSSVASVISDMITSSGLNIDVVYTESNQSNADKALGLDLGVLDFVFLDLYENRIDKLLDHLYIDKSWAENLSHSKASCFIQTRDGVDYIYLDDVL